MIAAMNVAVTPTASPQMIFFRFLVVWFGQLISLVGSGLTSFAVGVWVYTRTGSVTEFSLILVFASLPGIIIAPFAGVIVDRRDRPVTMMICDFVGVANSAILAILFFTQYLTLWEIYVLVSASSVENAFRLPAFTALSSQFVPAKEIGRVSGFMQIGPSIMQVCSPVLGAALIGAIGFQGVVLVDLSTFVFAIASLRAIIPFGLQRNPSLVAPPFALWKEIRQAWDYIAARPGLLRLVLFVAFINISFSFSEVLLTPMILSFGNTAILGKIMSGGAAGFLIGSISMSIWGGPRRRIASLLVYAILYGISFLLTGLRPSAWLVAAGLFLLTLQMPFMISCSQSIWQTKTPLSLQGRVFGLRIAIAWAGLPIAFFLAGPLADRVFEPLLELHGPLAHTWINAFGIGPGRGIALLMIIIGILTLCVTGACFSNRHLWHVEQELPEVLFQDASRPQI